MRFIYAKAGEPLEELAARAYDFEGTASVAKLSSAAKTLRDANPFLRKLSAVEDGTLLMVPELEGTKLAAQTEAPEAAAAALIGARLKDAAAQALDLLTGELDDETAAARGSLEVLRSAEARKLVRSDEEAKTAAGATEEAVKARLAAAEGLRDYRSQVAKQMESDLEELLGALRGAGGGQ
jgi:hypothetical protein